MKYKNTNFFTMERVKVISLEGLIGAGKSTLWRELKASFSGNPHFLFVDECVQDMERWRNYYPLKLMYENPTQEAFAVQMHIMECLGKKYETVKKEMIKREGRITLICDRYIDSPLVFIPTMLKSGYVTDFGADRLRYYFHKLLRNLNMPECTGVFYVDTPVDECVRRIKKRNRFGEDELLERKEYLMMLQHSYEMQMSESKCPWKKSSITHLAALVKEARDFILQCQ